MMRDYSDTATFREKVEIIWRHYPLPQCTLIVTSQTVSLPIMQGLDFCKAHKQLA